MTQVDDTQALPQSSASPAQLREFRESDLQEIVEIERELFANPWPAAAFRRFLRDRAAVSRIAEIDGAVAGYAFGWCVGEEAELGNLAVAAAWQRRSVASALLEWFLAACARRGVREVFLDVRASNETAKRLYHRHGFHQFGRRRNYYSRPREDALIYRAVIASGAPVVRAEPPPTMSKREMPESAVRPHDVRRRSASDPGQGFAPGE
jgi:ribosomal-protein-alanine N-acetyltransferase